MKTAMRFGSDENKFINEQEKETETEAELESDDEIQMSLAPYIQTYLAYSSSSSRCGCLPVPFERAAPHSWLRPCFDSDILENQFKISSFKQFTKRFRYGLMYMISVSGAWLVFLLCQPYPETITFEYVIFAQLFLTALSILFLTEKKIYRSHGSLIAGATALHLVLTCLVFTLAGGTRTVSHFTLVCCAILLIYTVFPLQPYASLVICVSFSLAFEAIFLSAQRHFITFYYGLVIRILCHVCVHVVGFHILVMTHVRVRGTFMKVGQRLLVRKQLEMEKQLKEKMIHSVMPPKVAGWLLSGENGDSSCFAKPANRKDLGSLFRPFNMYRMDNVSILFADIVGFTKMSSNKTAEQIVDILNDLFERFDDLCVSNGCEKISTLGDCYYCVSGCPEPRTDHAKCCVEMGLDMIDAIQEFDVERGEDVNMRVGVHTGTVLCGLVGTRRFKFDVWSNDVTFANKLESTGLPGRVHVSEQTALFLHGSYDLENYHDLQGTRTFLIKARQVVSAEKGDAGNRELTREPQESSNVAFESVRKSCHLAPKRSHYLSLLTEARSKFTSLPNVLSSSHSLGELPDGTSSSAWYSFSKIKNSSSSDISSGLKRSRRNHAVLGSQRKSLTSKQERKMEEEVSLCPSASSRKSSGVRSNSRRSSIQHQIYMMNGIDEEVASQRLSGLYASSQSTLSPRDSELGREREEGEGKKRDMSDNLGSCFFALRKQSDLQLIRCVNDVSRNSYVVKAPLHPLTLFFNDRDTEKEYREKAHKIDEKKNESPTTLSTSRFNTYFDVMVSAVVLVCTTVSLYVLYEAAVSFVVASTVALLVESLALTFCAVHLIKSRKNKFGETGKFTSKKILSLFSEWYPWHFFGGTLACLPMLVILANFTCHYAGGWESLSPQTNHSFDFLAAEENKKLVVNVELRDEYYTLLILMGLLHFANFAQLNFFMKSSLALVTAVIYLALIGKQNCQRHNKNSMSTIFVSRFLSKNILWNATKESPVLRRVFASRELEKVLSRLSETVFDAQSYYEMGAEFLATFYTTKGSSPAEYRATDDGAAFFDALERSLNASSVTADAWTNSVLGDISDHVLNYNSLETGVNIFVMLCLVVFLNREFEISYRLSYYCNTESSKDKMRVQNMKNQADWLLENIIPKHVSVELKNRAKYCENHSQVAIIFASIVNFNKLYDESYSGGKEYLRVLNELISDFDELLDSDKFKNVDKIKTIGSTFMGASGLNPGLRKLNETPHEHVFELMEFAIEMYRVVEFFNRDLLGFNLVLRVGFNVGEVTAGVIGSTKLFYDIWGDAVNVASRMDSCGVDGRIQVPYSCLALLSSRYSFEPRGSVYVKGKGDILVYLLQP